MGVVDILVREHDVLRGLLDRIERSFRYEETTAREELRNGFLLLLPALDRHERLERTVFARQDGPERERMAPVGAEIEAQHRELDRLKSQLLAALEDAQNAPLVELRRLSRELCGKLRLHFRAEERRLWPGCRPRAAIALQRRALRQVRELERSVEENRAAIADDLGRRR